MKGNNKRNRILLKSVGLHYRMKASTDQAGTIYVLTFPKKKSGKDIPLPPNEKVW